MLNLRRAYLMPFGCHAFGQFKKKKILANYFGKRLSKVITTS
jgi:hypothetical protein